MEKSGVVGTGYRMRRPVHLTRLRALSYPNQPHTPLPVYIAPYQVSTVRLACYHSLWAHSMKNLASTASQTVPDTCF